MAKGSIDDFFNQPSVGGGPALKFAVGTRHAGIVARPVTSADVQQQTVPGGSQPAYYKDGRPKFVLKIPLVVQPSQEHPDGQAQWYVSGGARDELVRAMAEAGAPEGAPESGAGIVVECTGTRPAGAGMNPAKVYKVSYTRPQSVTTKAVETPNAVQAAPTSEAPSAPQPPDDMDDSQRALLSQLSGRK